MGRRRSGLLDNVATLPWSVGIGGYLMIGHIAPKMLVVGSGLMALAFMPQGKLF